MQVEATGQRFRLEEQMIKVKVEDGKIKELRVRLLLQHCYKMGTEYRAPQSANPPAWATIHSYSCFLQCWPKQGPIHTELYQALGGKLPASV